MPHHLNLAMTSKHLIVMILIHLVLDVNLQAESFVELLLQSDNPAGLRPMLQLKVTITRISKHLLLILSILGL